MFEDIISTATSTFQDTTGFDIVSLADLFTESLAPLFTGVFMAVLVNSVDWIVALGAIALILGIPYLTWRIFYRDQRY